MPQKHICRCPTYPKTMTSSWELSTPSLVSEFSPPSLGLHLLTVFMCAHTHILCLPGVLSVLGNGILLFVAFRKKSSLKPAEYFVVNLAISDLGMTTTLFPLAIPSAYAHMWVTTSSLNRKGVITTGERMTCPPSDSKSKTVALYGWKLCLKGGWGGTTPAKSLGQTAKQWAKIPYKAKARRWCIFKGYSVIKKTSVIAASSFTSSNRWCVDLLPLGFISHAS